MLALGLNSGSSFDGIDAVLIDVDLGEDGLLKRPCFIAGKSVDWPKRVADQVLAAFENELSIFELCRLNYVAGALYAEAARSLMRETQTPPEAFSVIGFDGSVATILAHDARGRWASSARLTAHAALSNKSAMTTAWPRIS